MAIKKYIVDLTPDEREQLLQLIGRGKESSRKLTRARILIKAAEGLTDNQIAAALNIGVVTVERIRKRFVQEGVGAALNERERPGREPKMRSNQEAYLIALACSKTPQGHKRWTLRLLADKVVELGFASSFSHEGVRKILKKTNSNPGR